MKYKINELTPKAMMCVSVGCPSIYERLRELAPYEREMCVSVGCPSTYSARREGKDVYLIIGKVVNPSEVGLGELEKRIGKGEALIEVPKSLIDNKGK